MSRLLYIESSPRKKRSSSIQVADVFIESYLASHPSSRLKKVDLWEKELPEFDGDIIDKKYAMMHGESQTSAQSKSWKDVEEIITEFKESDLYLFSIPMWNFSIPYKLKHYIDLIVQSGYTFSYSPSEGYKGLVTGKTAVVIYARGGAYGPGTGGEDFDYQKKYFEVFLKFIGFTDIRTLLVEPTESSAEDKQVMLERIEEEASKLAKAL